ncbi:MAG: protein kinase [Myxococcales bacterium]
MPVSTSRGARGTGQHTEFRSTRRFRIERRLGKGGMGVVYLAYDEDKHDWVALKTLSRPDAEGIYRFKNEFRALADLRHDNLVKLHELFDDGEQWFFTMELVEGEDLIEHLHGGADSPLAGAADFDALDTLPVGQEPRLPSPAQDPSRVRGVFVQVAEALCALHAARKLHRDLKPENVMVDRSGRAVVLDFGIAGELRPEGKRDTFTEQVLGTPAYMAPEQTAGAPDERSDWYAYGAMLYEVLTGALPIDADDARALMRRKQQEDPAPPSALVSGVPEDLEELCTALLHRDPAARPTGAAVVSRLQREITHTRSAPPAPTTVGTLPFVGREEELGRMRAAYERTQAGSAVLLLLQGQSGIGKTTLAQHFLRTGLDEDAVVLGGRCYEHESVAFKGLDSVVDALSRYLRSIPTDRVGACAPRHVDSLVSVFPVLGRVATLSRLRARSRFALPADRTEVRRQAFAALRELLGRIADQVPLVVYVDDLHWGDVDSAALLSELIAPPGSPALLLMCTLRSEETSASACLKLLRTRCATLPPEGLEELTLSELSPSEARALTGALVGAQHDPLVEALARESGGSPFLLTELSRYALMQQRRQRDEAEPRRGDTLASALQLRLEGLSADARELLELLSVAGRPLTRRVYGVVRQHNVDLQQALMELRQHKLVRSSGGRGALVPYHDRIREAVVAATHPAKRVLLHQRLASVLEAGKHGEPEALARHFREAGEPDKALEYAIDAAERAASDFAFERAAALYRLALGWLPNGDPARFELLTRLAESFALADRRAEAADLLLEAADQRDGGADAAELRRRAAEILILGGHVRRGVSLLEEALSNLGVAIPDSPRHAMEAWAALRTDIARRGYHCSPHRPAEMAEPDARRLDTMWAAAFGLIRIVGPRAYPVLGQHVLDVLEHGDVVRVVRAVCFMHAMIDVPTSQISGRPPPDLEPMERLALGLDDARCEAWLTFARGCEAFFADDPQAHTDLVQAAELFRTRCAGSTPEVGLCMLFITGGLSVGGGWDEMLPAAERFSAAAAQRGDPAHRRLMEFARAFDAIARGHDSVARELLGRLSQAGRRHGPLVLFPLSAAMCALAAMTGDPEALSRSVVVSRAYLETLEGQVPRLGGYGHLNRARALLALGPGRDPGEAWLQRAETELDSVLALSLRCFAPQTLLNKASIAARRGNRELALAFLDGAIEQREAAWPLLSHVLSLARARISAGATGSPSELRAREALRDRGVQDVDALVRAFAPALPDA